MEPRAVLAAAVYSFIIYKIVNGLRTGRIRFGGITGDRTSAVLAYRLIMGLHFVVLGAILLAALGIYGQLY